MSRLNNNYISGIDLLLIDNFYNQEIFFTPPFHSNLSLYPGLGSRNFLGLYMKEGYAL